MGIDGLSTAYLAQINQAQTNANSGRVEKLVESDLSTATDEELMDACQEFESYLLEQVMKEMEKTTSLFSDEEDGSESALVDYFMDSTIQELATDVTEKQGLGIAQTLYESMKRQYGL